MRFGICLMALALAGCSTDRALLELKRERLLQIEQQALSIRGGAEQGSFDPTRYDLYLALDADVFTRLLEGVEGNTVEVVASNRPIELTVDKVEMTFRPGSPEIELAAKARDVGSGLIAELQMDSRLVIEGEPARPDELLARIVATRIVPRVRWGPFDFTKRKFVRSLLSLEAARFTERLPAARLPLAREFAFGKPANSVDSGQIKTTRDSWIRGNLSFPSTEIRGRFVVHNVLFLENGIHLFANVEGI